MSTHCHDRFKTWISQTTGGDILGEVVVAELYDAAQAELAALREELATLHDQHAEQSCIFCNNSGELLSKVKSLSASLTAAEQRNADLLSAMEMMAENSDDGDVVEICRHHIKTAKTTESGASE